MSCAKSLTALSRSVINRNTKIQDIDSLPLPQILRNECFENTSFDRCNDEPHPPKPCDCCNFPTSHNSFRFGEICLECTSMSMYDQVLPEILADAEWLKLPDRESLFKLYQSSVGEHRQMLEACLNTIRFDPSTGLGDVHEWIRRFMFYRLKHGWYYLTLGIHCFKKFTDAIKDKPIVVLPYGCLNDDGKFDRFSSHHCHGENERQMIVVIKDNDDVCLQHLKCYEFDFKVSISTRNYTIAKIRNVLTFTYTIDDMNDASSYTAVFNPTICHSIWWLLLLIPRGYFDNSLNKYSIEEIKSLENCVVKFDPLHQRIGDEITNLTKHIKENRGFVYWFDGKVLNVKEIDNVPSFITQADNPRMEFFIWCISRGINTLMNLNGFKYKKDYEWNSNKSLNEFDEIKMICDSDESSSDDETIIDIPNLYGF